VIVGIQQPEQVAADMRGACDLRPSQIPGAERVVLGVRCDLAF